MLVAGDGTSAAERGVVFDDPAAGIGLNRQQVAGPEQRRGDRARPQKDCQRLIENFLVGPFPPERLILDRQEVGEEIDRKVKTGMSLSKAIGSLMKKYSKKGEAR